MECKGDSSIVAEDGWFEDADGQLGDIVDEVNLGVIEHDKADIFVVVVSFIGYFNGGYLFLFQFATTAHSDQLSFLVSQFYHLQESFLQPYQNYNSILIPILKLRWCFRKVVRVN